MSSSGSVCTRRWTPTAACCTTSTIWRSSTRACTSSRTPPRASGRRWWSRARTALPRRCAASPVRTGPPCPRRIRRSATSGAMKARRPGCATPRTRFVSSSDSPTASARAWSAPGRGRRTSPKRSPTWGCRPSSPSFPTWSHRSTRPPIPRSARRDCGSSCAPRGAATCESTAPWTTGWTLSARRRPLPSCSPTTIASWARGPWRSRPTTTALKESGGPRSRSGRTTSCASFATTRGGRSASRRATSTSPSLPRWRSTAIPTSTSERSSAWARRNSRKS